MTLLKNKEVILEDSHLKQVWGKEYYFDNPLKKKLELKPGNTFILRGSRQVGKTTLLKEKIREALMDTKIEPENCLYLSCETIPDYQWLQHFLSEWLRTKKTKLLLLCLDEISFVSEWQRAVLWLINAGLLRQATTIITGSNARDLKKMAERFPGRRTQEIKIFPFSLADYAQIPCFKNDDGQKRLETYFRVGGFPHAVRDFCETGRVQDETYETYANWIFGDAHRFGLGRELLTHILFRIFDSLASQVTWQRLIEKSPVKSHETAAAYVEHLETAFLCHVLHCFDPDKEMSAPRKARKIYFIDPLLYGVVGGYLRGFSNTYEWWKECLADSQMKGNIFESIVVGHFSRRHEPLYFWYSSTLRKKADLLVKKGGKYCFMR